MEVQPMKEWGPQANCLDQDPELFFPIPEDKKGINTPQTLEAKAVCEKCSVVEECFNWATAHGVDGIWGNTTKSERDKIKRSVGRRAVG